MDEKTIKLLTQNLLDNLDISLKDIQVVKNKDETFAVDLKVSDEDTGLLIGYHGDTIAALQMILGMLLYKKTDQWIRLIVNVGDYRQKRTQALEEMAQNTTQRVKFSGEPIALFNLNPFERRLIHEFLSNHPDVITESQGEGKNRHLIVALKNPDTHQPPPPDDKQAPPADE